MALILSLAAGVRIESTVVLLSVATAAQMLQGYSIESAVSQMKPWYSFDILLPLIAGWGLFAATWYTIITQWYSGFEKSRTSYDDCPDDENPYESGEGGPPDGIVNLVWVVAAFFASFGIVNLAHIIVGSRATSNAYFVTIEMTYIALSFVSKAILVIWGAFTVFSKLEWLQICGAGDKNCTSPYLPNYDADGNKIK